jgi:hypothetical protein
VLSREVLSLKTIKKQWNKYGAAANAKHAAQKSSDGTE